MDKLLPKFSDSIFDKDIADECANLAGLSIDTVLDIATNTPIPIVSLLVGMGKIAQNIYDRNLLRQTIRFIASFNNGTLSEEKLQKHRRQLEKDSHRFEDELGRIVTILNSIIDTEKSEILAKLYRAYINEEIKWELFCELSDILSRMIISDIDFLLETKKQSFEEKGTHNYRVERLRSLGLVNSSVKDIYPGSASYYISTNELGNRFCDIILS